MSGFLALATEREEVPGDSTGWSDGSRQGDATAFLSPGNFIISGIETKWRIKGQILIVNTMPQCYIQWIEIN